MSRLATNALRGFRGIGASERAVAAVEMALAAPLAMMMLTGVMQIGLAMQAHNAMRGVAGDLARHTVVQYQTGNELSDDQISGEAIRRATSSPYMLKGDNLDIVAETELDSGIAGVKLITVEIDYEVPSIMPFISFETMEMNVTKAVYVPEDAGAVVEAEAEA